MPCDIALFSKQARPLADSPSIMQERRRAEVSNPNGRPSTRFQDGAGPGPVCSPCRLGGSERTRISHPSIEVRTAFQAGPAPRRFRFLEEE